MDHCNHLIPDERVNLARLDEFDDFSLGMDYSSSPDKKASAMQQGSLFTFFEDVQLTDEERVYLNAASMGDVGIVRMSLEEKDTPLNVNCVDYMGRNALHIAIDTEKLHVIEILLDSLNFSCIEEALLHAISKGASKIVKNIIEHPNFMASEDKIRRMAGAESFFRIEERSQFSPDITPLILAAHYNNHEIIQMFLSRNHFIEKPHPISCNCTDCVIKQNYDSLKRSRSRLNAYRALASPAYMALSSPDPIMTTFELRQEMMKLSEVEKEFKNEYLALLGKCMNFACELMDLCRGTQEVEAVLCELSDRVQDPLARLKMAIRYEEKKFVAHPNCQQHMTSIWYGSEMGFLQGLNWFRNFIYTLLFIPIIPFMCVIYVIVPGTKLGAVMRCPVTKFMTHTVSHMCFLILLAVATFRLTESDVSITTTAELTDEQYEHLDKEEKIESLLKETLRPTNILVTHVQICIVFWILGLLWIECKQIYNSGARLYIMDYYNFMDFSVLSMYLASYVMRFFTDHMVAQANEHFNGTARAREFLEQENYVDFNLFLAEIKDQRNFKYNYFMEASRFQWEQNDPEIISDALFAVANVISFARTTYLMPAFEVLGPLQISLGRMIGDITRFMVLFMLVLFAFMVGLHNLYWYYGAQRIKMEIDNHVVLVPAAEAFQGLKQTFYSLFWSMFGQISIDDITVRHPGPTGVFKPGHPNSIDQESTTAIVETIGLYLFGVYHVVIIIVLINMLIAMMSHSFEDIQTDCDMEWKFARTRLWMNYMDDGSSLPVPFNMIPTVKSFWFAYIFCRDLIGSTNKRLEYMRSRKQTFIKKRRLKVCKNLDLKPDDASYADIMTRLVKRYLFKLERTKEEKDTNKDISVGSGGGIRGQEIELLEAAPDYPPPDPPSKIPFATPPIGEDEEMATTGTSTAAHRRKAVTRSARRASMAPAPVSTALSLPQLDAIQRSQKLLDVRLQHLQANHRENSKMMDDVDFIRRLMTENQKALFNIIQALANVQCEIVNLAQCLKPSTTPTQNIPNAVSSNSRRRSKEDESKV